MRKLIIGGDSFTLGSELKGEPWANLLSYELGYQPVNVSQGGIGNAAIARHVINSLQNDCAVVVMWTYAVRLDVYHKDNWKTLTVHNKSTVERFLFNEIGNSEFYELHNTLTNVLLLQLLLEKNKIPFLFTCAEKSWNTLHAINLPWIQKLLSCIDWTRWYDIDNGNGFYEWAKKHYPCGPFGHPLDQAHIDLCKDIKPFATKLIGFSN